MNSTYFSPIALQPGPRDRLQLPSSFDLKRDLPLGDVLSQRIQESRSAIRSILDNDGGRLLVIVGPCSLHDYDAALEYADRLSALSHALSDDIYLVMRAYVEKPRTTVGWKGLAYDPWLDGSNDSHAGLELARRLLREIVTTGIPIANEILQPIASGYFEDLMSWAAIGARTTESQVHRELVSGLGLPAGFKNGTDGSVASACDAIRAAAHPHTHFGINDRGYATVIHTTGNPDTHLVLRGGGTGPNFDSPSIANAKRTMANVALAAKIVVDCSHGNSGKVHSRQPEVFDNVLDQRLSGELAIKGMMIESHLKEGSQSLGPSMQYGVSVTDACLGWEDTEAMLRRAALRLSRARKGTASASSNASSRSD